MAKSLRSKSKLRAKSVKRKGEFSNHVDARNKRLAQRLEEETRKQQESKGEETMEGNEMELDDQEEKSEGEKIEDKKISTSGWRDSRKQIYKQRKVKAKKNKSLKF